ncbi:MAG: hypothetical protein PHS02_04170 [Candidatus ainarchaeum sp.]|nr:hypothetical protein [Candidatus ainarchaeum sp.]
MEEKSGFVKLFGEYPMVKVIDFLITYREFDYPLSEIAENSDVAWSTIHTFFPQLVASGLVKETRQIGRAKLYKLDTGNPIAQELISLDNKLIKAMSDHAAEDIKVPSQPARKAAAKSS